MRRFAAHCLSVVLLSSFVAPAQDTASQDPKPRRKAARDLADQGPDAIPKLRPLLSDPDLDVRIEAVKSIVQIDTDKSLDPLIQAARDNDPEIQIRAADGLVNFYLPGYVKSGLTASLRRAGASVKGRFTETNDQVVDAYIQVRPEVVEALGTLARGGSSMESRANAARAVGVLRGAAAVPDLLEAVKSKDSQVIYESLIALQKIRDPAPPGRSSSCCAISTSACRWPPSRPRACSTTRTPCHNCGTCFPRARGPRCAGPLSPPSPCCPIPRTASCF